MVEKAELTVSSDDIRHMCGDIPDWKVAAIAALTPEPGDIEVAVAWADQLDETRQERPLEGAAAQIFDILMAGEEEEDRR
jgi:hypothetical protein